MLSISVFVINFLMLTFCKAIGYSDNIIIVFLAMGLQTISIIIDIYSSQSNISQIRLQLISAYFIRILLLFIDVYGKAIITLPQSGADSKMYYDNAVTVMNTGGQPERGGYFSLFMGNVFKLIGTNQLYAQYLILLVSMVILYLIAKVLIDLKINEKIFQNSM